MPELPEVETVRQGLDRLLTGQTIRQVLVRHEKLLRGQAADFFRRQLQGQTIIRVERRAKYLLIRGRSSTLLVHLGMTGRVLVLPEKRALELGLPDKHTHLILQLNNGLRFFFHDPRRFGRFQILTAMAEKTLFDSLGPEPLSAAFRQNEFTRRLQRRKSPIKVVLLNQKILAGLGNIYADEALYLARISPFTSAARLDPQQVNALHRAIRTVLRRAVRAGGTTISDYRNAENQSGRFQLRLNVYGREDEPCRRCSGKINKRFLAQRGTHWCPACQPEC